MVMRSNRMRPTTIFKGLCENEALFYSLLGANGAQQKKLYNNRNTFIWIINCILRSKLVTDSSSIRLFISLSNFTTLHFHAFFDIPLPLQLLSLMGNLLILCVAYSLRMLSVPQGKHAYLPLLMPWLLIIAFSPAITRLSIRGHLNLCRQIERMAAIGFKFKFHKIGLIT
jgi:hypothetical protein